MENVRVTSAEAILEQAIVIAKSEGIEQLNIRRLAKDCNIAIGSVYNYYKNKDTLLKDVAECFWKELLKDHEKVYRKGMRFTAFLTQYYSFVYSRMKKYDRDWLDERIGKPFEREVSQLLKVAMEEDKRIDPSIWNMELTKVEFVQHVLVNMTALLRKGETNCRFFAFLLEKLLYEE